MQNSIEGEMPPQRGHLHKVARIFFIISAVFVLPVTVIILGGLLLQFFGVCNLNFFDWSAGPSAPSMCNADVLTLFFSNLYEPVLFGALTFLNRIWLIFLICFGFFWLGAIWMTVRDHRLNIIPFYKNITFYLVILPFFLALLISVVAFKVYFVLVGSPYTSEKDLKEQSAYLVDGAGIVHMKEDSTPANTVETQIEFTDTASEEAFYEAAQLTETTDWLTYTNSEYGFSIKHPAYFDAVPGEGGAVDVVMFSRPGANPASFAIKGYVEPTEFATFDEYASHRERHGIERSVEANYGIPYYRDLYNDGQITKEEFDAEYAKYTEKIKQNVSDVQQDAQFIRTQINGVDVLLEFATYYGGYAGVNCDMRAWLGDGLVLMIHDECSLSEGWSGRTAGMYTSFELVRD